MTLKTLRDSIIQRAGLSKRQLLYIGVALLSALLLFIIGSSGSEKEDIESKDIMSDPAAEYTKRLSDELEYIVSKIDGVGNADVMLTFRGSMVSEFQTDVSKEELSKTEKTVIIGNKEAILKETVYPEVTGVLIVCDGGGSVAVKERVINAVSTVLNISSSKVYVTNRIKER
ncbi:MAG TPA: hypothetical protein IAD28_01235 [Candidatus Faeciplasma avium]|mgnify:FL=1|uniref:Stage III sporulation protein AG n=1 Tax=Candidatus Faeciplasma avium TaxID=2840798 RepID=A0A9D1NQ91_9FIRM|nr:hypothetical protein [Candidatus Faeciplasma avium]